MLRLIVKLLGLERPNRFMLYYIIFGAYIILLIYLFLRFRSNINPLEFSQQVLIYSRIISSISIIFGIILLFENLVKNHRETEPVFSIIRGEKRSNKLNFIIENFGKSYIEIKKVTYHVKDDKKNLQKSIVQDSGYIDFIKEKHAEVLVGPGEKLKFTITDYLNSNDDLKKIIDDISHISVTCIGPSNTRRTVINSLNEKIYVHQIK